MATQLNGSIVKAFGILSLFSPGRTEINAALVSAELGLNAVTAHRFLRTLESVGALVAVTKGSYRLGFALVDLGDRASQEASLAKAVQPILDALTRDLDEGTMATVFETDQVVCIARAVSSRPVFVDIRIGSRFEAYCTAHGKLWLSRLPPERLARYLDVVERRRITSHTLVSREDLARELQEIRERGYAVNRGEREEDIRAVAVPVTTRGDRMIAGLSTFGPAVRMTDAFLLDAVERLRRAAAETERALYGPPGGPPGNPHGWEPD